MLLWSKFESIASKFPSNSAIHFEGSKTSYADLKQQAESLSKLFEKQNIGPGSVLCTFLADGPQLITTLLACYKQNATIVVIDSLLTGDEIKIILNRLSCDIHLITTSDLVDRFPEKCQSILALDNARGFVQNDLSKQVKKNWELQGISMIQFTSGSTGLPKGILLSDEALYFRSISMKNTLGLGNRDKTLCAVSLSHSHGIESLALPTLVSGAELFILPPWEAEAGHVLSLIEKHGITFFSNIPAFYKQALEYVERDQYDLRSLKLPFCGSAPLAPKLADDFLEKFKIAIRQGYGLTEIGVISLNMHAEAQSKSDSVGSMIEGIKYRVEKDGELIVTSEALFLGYFNDIELTAQTLVHGELRTGDLVRIDDCGYMYIIGRKSTFINVAGLKVYPSEIEKKILELDFIKETAVTSEPCDFAGEQIVAHIVVFPEHAQANLDQRKIEMTIRRHLMKTVSLSKIPSKFFRHKNLPTSPLGKVLKTKLSENI